ncbi:hypothetical protein BDZ45DRAFT_741598 [Acephala macrosclerotiorum]|nr:hypothetical protein BDZ45DRAFT_741598 [Acephala macrosclerotiorum]
MGEEPWLADVTFTMNKERRTLQYAQQASRAATWIDENFIRSVRFGMGESINVKMICEGSEARGSWSTMCSLATQRDLRETIIMERRRLRCTVDEELGALVVE